MTWSEPQIALGAVFPQTEIAGDPESIRQFATAVERMGYDHVVTYDHVAGVAREARDRPLWGHYSERDAFHDPFVLLTFLAGVTDRLGLATGVLVLPQRQTVLVARQAADVDLLSGGRLRLGVGAGWNHVEYGALGADFATRGARLDEQIDLLRRLWREPLVSVEGAFHTIDRAGINPRPARAIPIWIGGFSERAYRRGGELGDGFSFAGDVAECVRARRTVERHLRSAGRASVPFGYELNPTRAETPVAVASAAEAWAEAGGTSVVVATMDRGFDSVEAHVEHLAAVSDAVRGRGL